MRKLRKFRAAHRVGSCCLGSVADCYPGETRALCPRCCRRPLPRSGRMPPPQYPRLARGLLVLCVILTHHAFAQTECPSGGGDPIVLQVDSAHGADDGLGSAVGTNCPDVGASHIESETDCVEAFLALCQGPLADDLFQFGSEESAGYPLACYMTSNTGCCTRPRGAPPGVELVKTAAVPMPVAPGSEPTSARMDATRASALCGCDAASGCGAASGCCGCMGSSKPVSQPASQQRQAAAYSEPGTAGQT